MKSYYKSLNEIVPVCMDNKYPVYTLAFCKYIMEVPISDC